MAETKERHRTNRKTTPQPDIKATAPRSASNLAAPRSASNLSSGMSADETKRLIAEAAYYRAKQRGFAPGRELEDWIEAESEVMGRSNGQPPA